MKIQGLPKINIDAVQMQPLEVGKPKGDDFAKQLMDVMKEVNSAQNEAKNKQTQLMTGQPVEFHDVMIAMEQAGVAMNLTMQVRNKVLEAYQEVMRLQV